MDMESQHRSVQYLCHTTSARCFDVREQNTKHTALFICSTYGIEYDVMYNSTKSNVLVFRSKLLKNVHVPEFEINNTAIDRVSM